MKSSTQKRIAWLSGPLLLSLLVVVLAVPIAQGSAAQRPIGWAWGYYYSDAGASKLLAMGAQPGHYVAFPVAQGSTNAAPASAATGTSSAAQRPIGWAWGYYYSDAGASKLLAMGAQRGYYSTVAAGGTVNIAQRPTLAQLQKAHDGPYAPNGVSGGGAVSAAQSSSSGISSTAVWIAAAAVLGALLLGAWALVRRRRRQH